MFGGRAPRKAPPACHAGCSANRRPRPRSATGALGRGRWYGPSGPMGHGGRRRPWQGRPPPSTPSENEDGRAGPHPRRGATQAPSPAPGRGRGAGDERATSDLFTERCLSCRAFQATMITRFQADGLGLQADGAGPLRQGRQAGGLARQRAHQRPPRRGHARRRPHEPSAPPAHDTTVPSLVARPRCRASARWRVERWTPRSRATTALGTPATTRARAPSSWAAVSAGRLPL